MVSTVICRDSALNHGVNPLVLGALDMEQRYQAVLAVNRR
jgi:hypothetical protein